MLYLQLGLNVDLPITNTTWIFFLVLIIILFAPILLDRLRIPHIIGMILAGVVIGEYGFNILERDSSFELFGKVGLYYIMFLGGLEMDMEDFKTNRMKTVVFGLLTFCIPMVLGVWSSQTFLDYNLETSILLASMYASHTLIAYPIVSRYGLSRLRSVSISVGATAITVTLALLILAIISGMYRDEVDQWFWIFMIIKVAIVIFIIVYTFPRVARWFFRKYEDNIMQFIFVLSLVFLGGGLFEAAGLEGILGAFMVGLILNRLVPNLSPLMNRLEFVGNALFIPYFLIGVGMIINIRTLFQMGEALKVAVVMTVVATFSKWLAAFITQKVYGMETEERTMMFGLSNAQAAATLAAVLVGNSIEISPGVMLLNDDVLNGTVVMILFTCIISSVMTERAARKFVMKEDFTDIESQPKEEENILIPVANPETIEYLMNMALVMKDDKKQNGLIALNVINDDVQSESKKAQGKRQLERAAAIGAAVDVKVETVARFDLNITSGILHTLQEYNASEVIIGLHRKANLMDSFLGTMTENLLKATGRQLMILKCLMPVNTSRRIVVAVPSKAEFEPGFFKWVERLCRVGRNLSCKINFYVHPDTKHYIQGYVQKKYPAIRVEYFDFPDWDDLLLLSDKVNYDHLLVVISARRGYISYKPSFDRLPTQLMKYFNGNSFMVVFPDQHGPALDQVSFSEPRRYAKVQQYNNLLAWFNKLFNNKKKRH